MTISLTQTLCSKNATAKRVAAEQERGRAERERERAEKVCAFACLGLRQSWHSIGDQLLIALYRSVHELSLSASVQKRRESAP